MRGGDECPSEADKIVRMTGARPFECPACRSTHHRCWACGRLVKITALVDEEHKGQCERCHQQVAGVCPASVKPLSSTWSPAQWRNVRRLEAQLPDRPWWVMVCPPDRPAHCNASPTLIMAYHHTTWRTLMPPCGDDCRCSIRALSDAEAKRTAGNETAPRNGGAK